jgi:hypothetical protein
LFSCYSLLFSFSNKLNLFVISFETSGSLSRDCFCSNRTSGIGDKINPDKDGSTFGDISGGDQDLEPGDCVSENSKK